MIRPRRSLRKRVALLLTSLCFVTLSICSLVIFLAVRTALLANLDRTLVSIARAEIASVVDRPADVPHLHAGIAPALSPHPSYTLQGAILDTGGTVLSATDRGQLRIDDRAVRTVQASQQPVVTDMDAGGHAFRVIYVPLTVGPESYVEILAISREPVDHALEVLALALMVTLVIGAVLAGLLAQILASRLTRPLQRILEATERVGREQDLSLRIPGDYVDEELAFVQARINSTLDLLESLFRQKEAWIDSRQQLLADLSHELRSPLTNLKSAIEVTLRHSRRPEEYREALADCLEEAERLSHLAQDLLTLSRAELERLEVQREPVDLEQLVAESIKGHAPRAEASGVSFEVVAEAATILGDLQRLRQVVDNLLENALRHAPPGSVIRVTTTGHGLTVSDQGPGIAAEHRARIFERFYRGDASRTRATGGVGLGLAICRAIVEAHGGSIEALASEQGATFEVTLPAGQTSRLPAS